MPTTSPPNGNLPWVAKYNTTLQLPKHKSDRSGDADERGVLPGVEHAYGFQRLNAAGLIGRQIRSSNDMLTPKITATTSGQALI